MKCQILFSDENKKNINLSPAELARREVKINFDDDVFLFSLVIGTNPKIRFFSWKKKKIEIHVHLSEYSPYLEFFPFSILLLFMLYTQIVICIPQRGTKYYIVLVKFSVSLFPKLI